jgi:2'-5' RNA ligase
VVVLTESAIVILVPEADRVLQAWRRDLDPSAALGVPAHVTLLFPFASPAALDSEVRAGIAAAIRPFSAFSYRLSRVEWFENGVAWLAPDPGTPFVDLTRALLRAFPDFPRYGGSVEDEIVPHVTIADRAPVTRVQEAVRDVEQRLPIDATVTDVVLLVGSRARGSWRIEQRLSLA